MAQQKFLGSKSRMTIVVAGVIYASIVISMALMARLALADSAASNGPSAHSQALDR